MNSRFNDSENEGLVVIGRPIGNQYDEPAPLEALAAIVDAWGAKLSLPLGLVYCGTTINWPEDVRWTSILIGLITFSGYGGDDEPVAGEVERGAMDLTRAEAIPAEFWRALKEEHGVTMPDDDDVYLAAAGWTWVSLHDAAGERVCAADTEGAGYRVIPATLRQGSWTARVGYC